MFKLTRRGLSQTAMPLMQQTNLEQEVLQLF
jgi:hypothetical protein